MAEVLFNTAGAHAWTVPVGVTSVKIELVGGGGGGGGGGGSLTAGVRGRIGEASEFIGGATSAAPGSWGGGGSVAGRAGSAGSPGMASSPGISGQGRFSGARNVNGLGTYGGGGLKGSNSGGGGSGGVGGGGAYWVENHSVTPGQELRFKVGSGGRFGNGGFNNGDPGDTGRSGAVRITYETAVTPSFSDDTGDAQKWVRNTVISFISIPRVAQGAPTPTYTSSGVPAGITVVLPTATADGSITGTPTSDVSGTITITATNASGSDTWTVAYNTMLDVSVPSFSDATGDAQTWSIGNTISNVVVPAALGTPTPAYAVQGSLPAGFSFNASTRTISGTPTSIGSGTITVRATNSEGSADWAVAYTITKLLSFPDDPIVIQDWSVGTAISDIVIPVAVGSITPAYAVQGSLPDGIAFDAGTRTLSGTPTTSVNVSTITIRATNSEARDDYSIRYLVRRASPTQTITLPISEYALQFSIIKSWEHRPLTAVDFDLAPLGDDLWFQGLRVISNGQVDIRFASIETGQSGDHTGDDLSDQFESQGQIILQHGANVLTLNMADTSDSDEPYTWQGDAAGTAFFRSIPSAGADIILTIRSKAPVVATLSASASTGTPIARAALVAAALSASVMAGVPTAQANLAPPTISMKASAGAPSASANLLPGLLPFDLSWAPEGGRTVYVSAVVTAGVPRGNGTVYENQPGRTPLGSVLAGSDLESQTGQSVTAIALNELFTGNITFWDAPSPLAWSTFFTDNPDVSLWMQFAPTGPIYPFVARGHGGSYSAWATADTAAQAAVTAARAEGARFAFVLRGAPAVTTLSASPTTGVPTGAANLQQPTLSTVSSAGAPTARVNLQGQLLSATASAGVPTATIDIEEQGVGINAYVPPSGYRPIVLAFLEADVSGADITAEPAVTIGTGNDLIVASDLVISQVERHVAGSQIRLRHSGDGAFSTYFDNEGSPLYPDARLQILYDRSLIDGSIDNTGSGFNNWSVANSAQRSKLNAIATGERFVLAILKKITIEASASAIAPSARVALALPLITVDASAGEPTARIYFDSLPLSASSTAGAPTARVDLVAAIISISASVGTPTARAALIPPTISLTATTNTPTAKASLAPPTLSASASAATPTARAYLASLVLTTNDIDLTNLDVYALALINTGTPTPNGTVYEDQPNRTPVGSIDAGGDLIARSGQDITRIALNIQGSGTVRFWDNPSEQSWTNFFGTYPRATLRLQFEILGPAYELTRGGQGGNFSNWSTSNTAARAAIASARANGKKFIFLLAEERIAVRVGEGERGSVATAGAEGTGRKIDAATRSGSGEFGESATEGAEGTGSSRTITGMGEGEVGRVTASGVEGQGASIVIRKAGSGELGKIITSGKEGIGKKIVLLPSTGSGEFGRISTAGIEGTGRKIDLLPVVGSGEFGGVVIAGAEGAGAKVISLPAAGSGEFGDIIASGKEGVGRRNAASTLSGTGEFGTVSSGGTEGAGRFGGSLAGFTKIAEVRGISFPRTGLLGDASYDITLRARDKTGNTGNLVPAGTVLTEDLLDVFGAEFVFKRNNTGVVPDPPLSTEKQRKTDNYIPTGWSDNAQGVDASNRYEYISSRTGSPSRWSEFGEPGLYNIYIEATTGAGGLGYEFIYRLTTANTTPTTPNNNFLYGRPSSPWKVNRQSPTKTTQFVWLSQRQIQGAPSVGDSISATWSTPILVGVFGIQGEAGDDGLPGISAREIIIYRALTLTANLPQVPSNASWDHSADRLTSITGWSRNFPSYNPTTQRVACTIATAFSDDTLSAWSTVRICESAGDLNAVYRRVTSGSTPTRPSAGTRAIPTGWVDLSASLTGVGLAWVSIGHRPVGSATWTWSVPNRVEGLDGRDGIGIEFIYATTSSNSAPSSPNNNWGYDRPRSPWNDGVPSNYNDSNPYLWISTRITIGQPTAGDAIVGAWASPALLSRFGQDAAGYEFIYAITASETAPSNPRNTWGYDRPSSPWFDDPPSTTASKPYLWRAQRATIGTPAAGDSVTASWTSPKIVGRPGAGGSGAQFIFRRTATASAPNTPPSSSSQRKNDSYVPTSWTNSPVGFDDTNLYEWVSSRTGKSGDWSVFSIPALWATSTAARGPIPFFRAISGSSWSNSEANSATTGNNVTGDRVTLYNSTAKWTATRVWNGSRWITIGKWIDGNLIVEGSVLSIFDIIAGAAVQSSNYQAGVDGWRIAQDGDAEFNGSVFAESIRALDIQNVTVLYENEAGFYVDGSKAATQLVLNDTLADYSVLEISVRVPAGNIYGTTAIPVSAIPFLGRAGSCSFSGGYSNQIITLILTTGSVGKSITVGAPNITRGYLHSIIGIKNPEAASTSAPGPADPTVAVIPTLVVENSSLTVEEGSTTRIKVKLSSQPTGNVTVTATERDSDVSVSPRTRTFSTTNWNRYQDFTVTGIVDADSIDDSADVLLTGSGSGVIDTATVSISITEPAITRPGTPSTPSVTTREQTSITFSTTPGSGGAATLYRWRHSTNNVVSNSDVIVTSMGPSITISGLTEDTNYWVDVRAENSAGNSAYSEDRATSTLASTPVTTVSANAGSDVSVESGGSIGVGGSDTVQNGQGSTTIAWTRVSGTGGSLSSTTIASPTFNAPTVTSDRDIVWRKTTTNNGVSDTDDVTITVTASAATTVTFSVSGTEVPAQSSGTTDAARNSFTHNSITENFPAEAFEDNTQHGLLLASFYGSIYQYSFLQNESIIRFSEEAELISDVENRLGVTVQYGEMSVTLSFPGAMEPYSSIASSELGALVDAWVDDGANGLVTITVFAS